MATSLSSRSSGRLHIATGRGGGAVVVAVAVVVVVVGDDGGTSAGAEVGVSEKIFIAFLNCSVAERISMICFFWIIHNLPFRLRRTAILASASFAARVADLNLHHSHPDSPESPMTRTARTPVRPAVVRFNS